METVFNRIEKKYLITKDDKKTLSTVIKKHMDEDEYHQSDVLNLYFDNDNYELITNSIDWVDFKEKIRARSYLGYDRVFLEIKTKIKDKDESEENIGYKRRVMLTNEEFQEFTDQKATLQDIIKKSSNTKHDLQIAKEIDYLIDHFELKPKILILYQRESYKGEGGLRVTFDENLSFRTNNLCFKKEKHDKIYFKDDYNIIMEVKASDAIPLWLVSIMSERKIYPQRFSKIGKVYEKIMNEPKSEKRKE